MGGRSTTCARPSTESFSPVRRCGDRPLSDGCVRAVWLDLLLVVECRERIEERPGLIEPASDMGVRQ